MSNNEQSTGGEVYVGDERIVVAIDLGTTYTGVSYTYLYPGIKPEVNSWPGQPEARGDSKIPTIIAYQNGVAKALGAEARDFVGDDEYEIAEWFKLHLHPDSMKVSDEPPEYGSESNKSPQIKIPPLPSRVALAQVYSDFLRYLYSTTQHFFEDTTPNGEAIWKRLQDRLVLILCTPNGWDLTQQYFLRTAVVKADIMTDTEAEERLEFVTEAEASVHFVLAHTQSSAWLQKGVIFCVVDAGGSTVDSTLYECKGTTPKLVLEEVCASWGVFVNNAATSLLENKLKNSKFGGMEYVTMMVDEFEKKTKRIFDGTQTSNIIRFGRNTDNDRDFKIIKGKISLSKEEVQGMFDNVIRRTLDSCFKLLKGHKIRYMLLVGGFGESPYLQNRLLDAFSRERTDIVTVREPSKKAAAEGAALWYIKHSVVARVVRFTFGIEKKLPYDANATHHRERESLKYMAPEGIWAIYGLFDPWVEKNTVLDDNFEKTFKYSRTYNSLPTSLGSFSLQTYAWNGNATPFYVRTEEGIIDPGMRELCLLRGDLSGLESIVQKIKRSDDTFYWRVDYTVRVTFGGTRVRARLEWKEGETVRQGLISILPNAST